MAEVYNSQLDAFDLYHQTYDTLKSSSASHGSPALPALGHALAGATGGAISNVSTYPLSLIIARLQIQRQIRNHPTSSHSREYSSIKDALQRIAAQEGFLGFYTGVLQDTSKTIADTFLFFLAYNFLRQTRLRSLESKLHHLPVTDELSVGFIAGAFSKFFTTPIANIVTQKQMSSMLSANASAPDNMRPSTVRSIALQIRSEKGLRGFWSGYSASLVLTLNPSLTFFFFESLKRLLLLRKKHSDPSLRTTFLLSAISKAMASCITYPFSIAKTRSQVSSKTVKSDNEVKEFSKNEQDSETTRRQKGSSVTRRTVFHTVLQIAREEGLGALYEGLEGELLKGFFSHGITMIVKDVIHSLIIQVYYAVLRLLKKYPGPEELARLTK